jgi:cyclopropane-fatty-acyl-phospholipid synthase
MEVTRESSSIAGRAVGKLLASLGDPRIRLELWNGESVGPPASQAVGTVLVRDARAALRLAADLELEAGDLYTQGRLDFEGDPIAIVREVFRTGSHKGFGRFLRPGRLVDWIRRTDPRSSRRSAQHHYDLGNEFYSLWLDERMVYTCAYFPDPNDDLEHAQVAKLEHVCRKLRLRPGEHVIEAGCGWGSLALHMARNHGVTVRAVNVSHEQILYAREQAEKQGLAGRVEFVEDDYRNLDGRCDKFVSVGMLEHVGPENYRTLGAVIDRVLAPHGLGLVHSMGLAKAARMNRWLEQRIFPNASTPSLRQMMELFEPHRFAVLDVENLRLHYALTLRHWLSRYDDAYRRIEELVGSRAARAWRLYLAGTAAGFEEGVVQLFQILFTRERNSEIPWTRAHLYSGCDALADRGDTRGDA